jgi:hypothetical protein
MNGFLCSIRLVAAAAEYLLRHRPSRQNILTRDISFGTNGRGFPAVSCSGAAPCSRKEAARRTVTSGRRCGVSSTWTDSSRLWDQRHMRKQERRAQDEQEATPVQRGTVEATGSYTYAARNSRRLQEGTPVQRGAVEAAGRYTCAARSSRDYRKVHLCSEEQ